MAIFLLNDEQMSNSLGVEHQPEITGTCFLNNQISRVESSKGSRQIHGGYPKNSDTFGCKAIC